MLLGIEIALFLTAWRRGWRWRALIPVAAMFGLAVVMVGAAGPNASLQNIAPQAFVLDVLLIICLGVMAAKAPGGESEPATSITAAETPADTVAH